MKTFIVLILAGFWAISGLGAKQELPETFSFETSNSGKKANGEYFRDNFSVTALGQVFWDNSSNITGPCPRLAGLLKGKLNPTELAEFAHLAKEALEELEAGNKSYVAEMNNRTSHEWKLTYGDEVYSEPINGGKEKVQRLQDLIIKIKNGLNASSVIAMEVKKNKQGHYELILKLLGKGLLALVFSDKVADNFGAQYAEWKYEKIPPSKIILNEKNPQTKLTLIPPKKDLPSPEHFIYTNFSLADHYETKELGDKAGYRPIKVCAPL